MKLDFLFVVFLIFTIVLLWFVFYETIIWSRNLLSNKAIEDKNIVVDDTTKERHLEKVILRANEFLFPCLQQMKWGKAQYDRNFFPAVQQLLRRDSIALPRSTVGLGNIHILALSAANAFEVVESKESENLEMQEVYAKEVIKGVVKVKGPSFFNHSLIEICDYFKTYPFGRY